MKTGIIARNPTIWQQCFALSVHFPRLFGFIILLSFVACSRPAEEASQPVPQESASSLDAEAIAANNRGVGLMGRFEYAAAAKVFQDLVAKHPKWLDARVNLSIATLNRQQEGDEVKALAMADEVIEIDPANVRAHYVAGLLRLYLSSPTEALHHFKRVSEADPLDAYAAYYLAQCSAQQSAYEAALEHYQKAMQLDPYLRSAYYGAFQTLQRLKRRDEAREVISAYQKLANNPRARLAEFKYTRMGAKGEALAVDLPTQEPTVSPQGDLFLERRSLGILSADKLPWLRERSNRRPLSVTTVDANGDGRQDLFIAGALAGPEMHNLLLWGRADGDFEPDLAHPLAAVAAVNAALWGDFDNDGLTDVYLARQGNNQLWRQTDKGLWEDVTAASRTDGGPLNTVDGAFFDADHDGDLDLFLVNADGPNELLNNNLDGTFRAIAAQQGIAGDGRVSHGVVTVDIDHDRDVDIVVLNEAPPHEVYLNDRLWTYRKATDFEDFQSTALHAGLAGDLDADGLPELYGATPQGSIFRWQPDGRGHVQREELARHSSAKPDWTELAIDDFDGDGVLELMAVTPAGWGVFDSKTQQTQALFSAKPAAGAKLDGIASVVMEPRSGPAIVAVEYQGGLSVWNAGPGRTPYVALTLSGLEDVGQSMRSNASGIGTRVAARVGSRWTIVDSFANQSGPGQSLQPIAVGLGGEKQADFVAIDWSDGVFQSELDLDSGRIHRITETQRQLSSCPVLFAWDGEKYAFVSDLLGVGGLGYATGPGEYATPRPWENILLPSTVLQPQRDRMLLKLTEPMEEVAYLDSARLLAYDLPPGWQMVLDERMGILAPQPTGEVRYFRHELLPVRARNERGQLVTETVAHVDGKAADVGPLDSRFIGRLKDEHQLTLHFAQSLDDRQGLPTLVIDGWVEYPYSQTMFAAWQAGAGFQAPTVEARGASGQWRAVLKEFGYPAGMPRRMSVPLENLPTGTTALRIRTNLEVYWDRIAIAFAQPLPSVQIENLVLLGAQVAKTGFPLRTTGKQHKPYYDYERRSPFWDTRYMAGFYTRLGPADALVAKWDDAVAVIGPGEEVHLEFAAPAQPTPPGWTRYYVLQTRGWTKDMDLFTKDGETVGPLPVSGRPSESRDRLHMQLNTRYQAGL